MLRQTNRSLGKGLKVPEAHYVSDEWRMEYNHRRPHSGIAWQTPAAFAATQATGA